MITYSNVVLPVVEYTIDILEDKGAFHLKETLNDYLVLLLEDEDGDKAKEHLANQLIEIKGIKQYIKINEKDKSFGSIYIKHKKVINYLCQLDQDLRTGSLNWWNKLKPDPYEIKKQDDYPHTLIFKRETSVRSYLMFSVLTESNRKNLAFLSDPSENWLDRICPISFEISLRLAYEKAVDDQQEKSPVGVNCSVTLVLGPLAEHVNRAELFNRLYTKLQRGKSTTKLKDKEFKGRFNRLISTRKLSGEGKSEIASKPIEWIENNILTVKNNYEIDLKQWIKDIAVELNRELDKYFKHTSIDTIK